MFPVIVVIKPANGPSVTLAAVTTPDIITTPTINIHETLITAVDQSDGTSPSADSVQKKLFIFSIIKLL